MWSDPSAMLTASSGFPGVLQSVVVSRFSSVPHCWELSVPKFPESEPSQGGNEPARVVRHT